jgi:hypothetical protein
VKLLKNIIFVNFYLIIRLLYGIAVQIETG